MSDDFAKAIGDLALVFQDDFQTRLWDFELDAISALLIAHAKDKRREIERLRFAFPDVFPEGGAR